MKISVLGLGYTGAVSSACFCELGHDVIGVEVVQAKREKIARGESPVIEDKLDDLIARAVEAGTLQVTESVREAVHGSDVSIVCVGTPSLRDGGLNLEHVERVCTEVGEALHGRDDYHVVVVRSTMLPGAAEHIVLPTLERASGRRAGVDFGFCVNPEFLREGSAVDDFFHPPRTVIGAIDERSGAVGAALYQGIDSPLIITSLAVAAMVKYADNAFHALKVVFGNEIGALCKTLGIDSHQVLEIFCKDEKLNISSAYLTPGFAFGGSCLPKDLKALLDLAQRQSVHLPMLSTVLPSNELHVRRFVDEVMACGRRPVAVLGLAFKGGTDDTRGSPIVSVVETLIGKGFQLKIYDHNISHAAPVGAGMPNEIAHISSLLSQSVEEAIADAEIVIVSNRDDEFARALREKGADKIIFDLVRQFSPDDAPGAEYYGICW